MKTLLSLLLLLVIFNTITIAFPQNSKTSIKLTTEKKVYYENELIVLRLKFINNDSKSLYIGYNCSIEDDLMTQFKFIDQNGKVYIIEPGVIVDCFGGHININPGEEYDTFGMPLLYKSLHKFKGIEYLPVGNYSVFNSNSYGISDTVHFEITQNEFKDNYQRLLELKEIKDKDLRLKKMRNYLRNADDSIFVNLLFDEILCLRGNYNDNLDLLETDMLFYFGINPDAWSNDLYIFHSAYIMKQEYKMFDFLVKLILKYPKTRVSYLAKKIINDKKIPFVF